MNTSLQLDAYREMMEDDVRMLAYQQAIRATCADRVVCEIGVGLAPLSLMALQAGARRVYGIEQNAEVLQLATALMRANGFGPDRFVPVQGLSHQVTLPERAEVLLSEILDAFGVGENAQRYIADARERHLVEGGRMIPERLQCALALAEPEVWARTAAFWATKMPSTYGLDYSAVLAQQRGRRESIDVREEELLSEWTPWLDLDLLHSGAIARVQPVVLQPTRAGTVSGLAAAFDATLVPGVHLRTFSHSPPTHWRQGFQPLPDGAVMLEESDRLYVELELLPGDRPQTRHRTVFASGPEALIASYAAQRRRMLGLPATTVAA